MTKPSINCQKKLAFLVTCALLLVVVVLYTLTFQNWTTITEYKDKTACSFHNHPYVVFVEFGEHICNGAILSLYYVITSAHCCNYDEYGAVYTNYDRERNKYDQMQVIRERKVHTMYSAELKNYDVCLVQLAKPLISNDYTKQVPTLNKQNLAEVLYKDGDPVYVDLIYTGYGISSADQDIDDRPQIVEKSKPLQCLKSRVLQSEDCRSLLGPRWQHYFNESNMFCTEAVGLNNQIGPCEGDTGGPVIWGGHTIGVISWGPAGICDTSVVVHTRIDVAEDLMRRVHLKSGSLDTVANDYVLRFLLFLCWLS